MKNILIICQARFGSTRLPGKVLRRILDKELLWYVVKRLELIKTPNRIIIATANTEQNKPIIDFAKSLKLDWFAGSEDDVLDRFYQAAKEYNGEIIVRITSDCPLTDPAIVDNGINIFLNGSYDYVSNVEPPTYPDGFDVEVFSFEALEKTWKQEKELSIREHVTFHIRKSFRNRDGRFRCFNFENKQNLQNYRLTVDTKEDFELISLIIKKFHNMWDTFTMEDIISYIDENPELKMLNAMYERDKALKNL